MLAALMSFSESELEDDALEPSLPLPLQVRMISWLRGELTQAAVEADAAENVRIAEVPVMVGAIERDLETLTRELRQVTTSAPESPDNPMLKLRKLARLYDNTSTGLLGAGEVFLNRWSHFQLTYWDAFEGLMSAWAAPDLNEALGRMALREVQAEILPPLRSEALEHSLALAQRDAALLLETLTRLCATTHVLLSIAHVLGGACTPEQLGSYSHQAQCFERFHSSFATACSPWESPSEDDAVAQRQVMRILTTLGGRQGTVHRQWQSHVEQKNLALATLRVAKQADEAARHAHLRRRARSSELHVWRHSSRKKRRRSFWEERSSTTSSSSSSSSEMRARSHGRGDGGGRRVRMR